MIAFLFPGQGSQRPRLLADCVALLGAREMLDTASDILHVDVLHDDDSRALDNTEVVQRNVFLAGLAGAGALAAGGVLPDIVAGHSIGAYAAAAVAGVLSFRDALELVTLRGKAMATALGPGYGMGAVLGLSEREVRAIVHDVRRDAAVDVAAVNAADQIVVAGTDTGVDRALAAAAACGARSTRRLDVPVASHTTLLDGVRDRLAIAFATTDVSDPRVPVAANVDGSALFRSAEVLRDLIEGIAKPVRWFDATQMLHERGTTCFVEPFLGDTLTVLAEAAFPGTPALSIGRDRLEATLLLAKRYG